MVNHYSRVVIVWFHKSLICLHPLGSDGLLWAIIAHVPPAFCFACERRSTSRTGVFFTSLHFLLLGCHVSAWHTSILIHFAPARNVRGIENVFCCFIKCAKLFVRFKPLFGLISCPPNQPWLSVKFFRELSREFLPSMILKWHGLATNCNSYITSIDRGPPSVMTHQIFDPYSFGSGGGFLNFSNIHRLHSLWIFRHHGSLWTGFKSRFGEGLNVILFGPGLNVR